METTFKEVMSESTMDPSCSQISCDVYEGTKNIPSENKTDNMASGTDKVSNNDSNTEQNVNNEQIDEIEREDFEEENRLIKHCSEIIVDAQKTSSNLPRNTSSANSSLASHSETISTQNRIEKNLPGCSSEDRTSSDSNTTIKNMMKVRRVLFENDCEPTKKNKGSSKLLSKAWEEKVASFTIKREEKAGNSAFRASLDDKESAGPSLFADSKNGLGAGHSSKTSYVSDCIKDQDASASSSSKYSCEDETSESKLDASQNPITRSFLQEFCNGDGDSDEDNESAWCICPSAHEVGEDSLNMEPTDSRNECPDDSCRIWRKRVCEPATTSGSSPAKKHFAEGSVESSAIRESSSWIANLQASSVNPMWNQGPPEIKQWLNRFNTWSNSEKLQAIEALISRSAACQVRHMMNTIEPLFTRDFISQLPKELALTVLRNLEAHDLMRAAQTCRDWRFLADDNLLWKEQCRRVGIVCDCFVCERRRRRYSPLYRNPWKAAFMEQHVIENNWTTRPLGLPIIMKGHDDHVITCLQFYGNRIVSGSDDTTLKVWCANTGRCLKTLVGHTGGVWSSQMSRLLVISGSTDRTLRVWNPITGHCLKVLSGHTSTVRCMHLYKDKVVSGSRDATLRVWSIPEGRCMRVLMGHLAAVRCVQYNGKYVVSGAYDYFVKIWNPDSGECLHTLAGHTNRVYSLQFDGVHVVSGSLDTTIRVWDVETGALKHTLIGHQSLTSGMELHSNILVSGNADSTVKVWDISTGQCLHTLSGPNKHQSAVTCLQSNKRFVMTSSDDGTVKLWDTRTGEFIRNLVELGSGGSGGVVWRIRASATKLICAVGSRNGTEETKLLVLDFGLTRACRKCKPSQ